MLESLINLLLIILGFGALIFVHELGHFLAARWAGIRTEVFAIGMGTPVVSWRKGVGFAWGSTARKVVSLTGRSPRELSRRDLDRYGLGATEYSLRWLPIGGFVKMLGQDDIDPGYVSDEPDSYQNCPVARRMVVVSAGVVANVILAVAVFIIAFMAGVRTEAPVVGAVSPTMPAAAAGLEPGDVIRRIDGKEVESFVDVQIATAMARPDRPLVLDLRRGDEMVTLEVQPAPDPATGLLGIGIGPARSNRLFGGDDAEAVGAVLEAVGLAEQGVEPGMQIASAAGTPVETFEQFDRIARRSEGRPVPSVWRASDGQGRPAGPPVEAEVPVRPTFELMVYPEPVEGVEQNAESGLLGLSPLVRIIEVYEGRHDNRDVLAADDVILRAGAVDGPRMAQLRAELARRAGGLIDLEVLRDGAERTVTAAIDGKGRLNVGIGLAWDLPLTAQPMGHVRVQGAGGEASRIARTPAAGLNLFGRTRIDAVGETPVEDWSDLREALRAHTRAAREAGRGAAVSLRVTHPTPGRESETLTMELSAADVQRLHELGWASELIAGLFEPRYKMLTAGGNPLKAAAMGFEETVQVMVLTYLTIDRLLRRSVGIEQIHGPVGIVHLGTKMADRGATYLLFFLGIISVNLAVINFLPIPIVDGGLFLFLIYEKLKGRPPPPAFQNAATIVGVAMIATVLLVVTWNDLMRLIG